MSHTKSVGDAGMRLSLGEARLRIFSGNKEKLAAGLVLLVLLFLPVPVLPPHWLAETVESLFGLGWKSAYLVAALGLRAVLYGSLGILATYAAGYASTRRGLLLQWMFVPVVVVVAALLIRSAKVGHFPVFANAAIPMAACFLGTGLGLLLRQRRWTASLIAAGMAIAALYFALRPDVSSALKQNTAACLRRLVESEPHLPLGEGRFAALCKSAFASTPDTVSGVSAIEENRAAILALGIAFGPEGFARIIGLNPGESLLHQANALRKGVTLRGREDWPRHFCVSAALVVLENPSVSDSVGIVKEQLDALSRSTGFSFADLAADRAGVRFAVAASDSEATAKAVRARLQQGFVVDDFLPPISDLPENLTLEQFRSDFGRAGDARYRKMTNEIEHRLDRCSGLILPQRNP